MEGRRLKAPRLAAEDVAEVTVFIQPNGFLGHSFSFPKSSRAGGTRDI